MQANSDQKILIKNKVDEFEKLMGKEKIAILIQRTLEESKKYITLLKESENLVDKRRAVHSLKSTSANYNYMLMADFAEEFERQLVAENTVNLADNTHQLEEFCSQLCTYLMEISE